MLVLYWHVIDEDGTHPLNLLSTGPYRVSRTGSDRSIELGCAKEVATVIL